MVDKIFDRIDYLGHLKKKDIEFIKDLIKVKKKVLNLVTFSNRIAIVSSFIYISLQLTLKIIIHVHLYHCKTFDLKQ